MIKFFWLLFFFVPICFLSSETEEINKFINFNPILEKSKKPHQPEDYAYYNELNAWAYNRGLKLLGDNNLFGLKDGICKTIPPSGLNFKLMIDASKKMPVYLYLDITRYRSMNKKKLRASARTLSIFVNGRIKQKIYFDGYQNYLNGKVVKGNSLQPIKLDPVEFREGELRIRLVPDPITGENRFWGIWDAFYSYNHE